LIQQNAAGASSILELGCGTGAHAAHFAELGYEVLGIDSSESMLQGARTRQSGLPPEVSARMDFSVGDVRDFRTDSRFNVVTALFHVISYQLTNEDLASTFATAAAHLSPGGIFLFDCWYGPAVLSDPPVVRMKRLEDTTTQVLRTAEPTMNFNDNVAEVDYHVLVTDLASGQTEEIRERHRMRYLFEPELKQYLQTEELEPVHFSKWMSDGEPGDTSWNVVMVARTAPVGEG